MTMQNSWKYQMTALMGTLITLIARLGVLIKNIYSFAFYDYIIT